MLGGFNLKKKKKKKKRKRYESSPGCRRGGVLPSYQGGPSYHGKAGRNGGKDATLLPWKDEHQSNLKRKEKVSR